MVLKNSAHFQWLGFKAFCPRFSGGSCFNKLCAISSTYRCTHSDKSSQKIANAVVERF